MEQVYRKVKGRYIPAGTNELYLSDGLWLITQNRKKMMNLTYYIGEVSKPVILNNHAYLQQFNSELGMYIQSLKDENSEEYKEAKQQLGGWITSEINITGISSQDLGALILKFLANKL